MRNDSAGNGRYSRAGEFSPVFLLLDFDLDEEQLHVTDFKQKQNRKQTWKDKELTKRSKSNQVCVVDTGHNWPEGKKEHVKQTIAKCKVKDAK